MDKPLDTFTAVLDLWPYHQVASGIGEKPGTVASWKSRDILPSGCWNDLVAFAKATGKRQVTLPLLARIAKSKRVAA